MDASDVKVGILFLGRTRPGFDEEWGAAMTDRVKRAVTGRSWTGFVCPTRGVDDATLRRAVDECRSAACDTLVVLQTTMSDGRLAPILAQLWDRPVVFWATPEKPEGDLVSSCSLVGTHLFASVFARLRAPFEVLSGAPEDPGVLEELEGALRATAAVARLARSKVGLVGYHAPGFINMHVDPYRIADSLGAELYHTGQQDLLDRMAQVSDSDVTTDLDATMDLGMPLVDLTRDDLAIQSRYYLGLKELIADEHLDALAVRCWPELPNLTGQWPYLAMVRLADEGYPITMEGDVDGAIGMAILRNLGLETGFLTDWLEHEGNDIVTWHGGGTPGSLAAPEGGPHSRTIARHFNSSKPAVVDGWIAAGRPVTIHRFWSDADSYHMMAREAQTVAPKRHLRGTNGRIRLGGESAGELFDMACHAGMPHHLCVAAGHHGELLGRVARLLRMQMV